MSSIEPIPIVFSKPPRRFLGITLCNHVWKPYWHSLDESTQVCTEKCARCLKMKKVRTL